MILFPVVLTASDVQALWVAYAMKDEDLRLVRGQSGKLVLAGTLHELHADGDTVALDAEWATGAIHQVSLKPNVPRAGMPLSETCAADLWNAWSFYDDLLISRGLRFEFGGRVAKNALEKIFYSMSLDVLAAPQGTPSLALSKLERRKLVRMLRRGQAVFRLELTQR